MSDRGAARLYRVVLLAALIATTFAAAHAANPVVKHTYDAEGNLRRTRVCQTACDPGVCGNGRTMPDGCGGVLTCPACTSCGTGFQLCGGDCLATGSDPLNCGGCGQVCPATPSSPAQCVAGQCYSLFTDPLNCGAVGNVCSAAPNATPACSAVGCWSRCNPGYSYCDGACVVLAEAQACSGSGAFDASFDLVLH